MSDYLRPYQSAAKTGVLREWESAPSTLVVMPTGCVSGDTVIGMNRASKGYARKIRKAFECQFDVRVNQSIPTKVRSMMGDHIALNECKAIVHSGARETFALALENGFMLRATPNHEVFTDHGFVALGDLKCRDNVAVELEPTKRLRKPKLSYRQVQGLLYHPHAGHCESRTPRGNHVAGRLYRVPYHRLVVEADINRMDLEAFIARCRDGVGIHMLQFLDPEEIAVHHKDGNPANNSLSNLEPMTHTRHWSLHGSVENYRNFGYGVLGYSKVKWVRQHGIEETYDVVCDDPHRNFVANGIVVHNCGKTVLFAAIIEACLPRRSLVLAHREELIWQARDKIERFAKASVDIEMADLYATGGDLFDPASVVVSTVQTQRAARGDRTRMSRFKPTHFDRIIFDECHHATADSYTNIKNYYAQNPYARFLGVTATPDRADEEALGQVFDSVAYDYEILDAIRDGWLVPIEQQFVHVSNLVLDGVNTLAGDLNIGELSEVMEQEKNLQGVAAATLQIIGQRRAIVFTASVKQAEMLSNIFNRHKFGMAHWVHGGTPKDIRRPMIADFAAGKFQLICNCGVLTEGYDDPGVGVIVMARPTKSRALYAQMAGRGFRPLDGLVDPQPDAQARHEAIARSTKPSCLLVDFVGNSGKHKLMSSADILDGNYNDEAVERAVVRAKNAGGPVKMTELLEEEEHKMREDARKAREAETARLTKLKAQHVKFTTKRVNPFDVWDLDPVKERGWDVKKTLSQKQKAVLLKQGLDPDEMTYAQGRAVLNEMFRRWNAKLCTLKQAALLKKHGFETHEISMSEASRLIDELARNGWRRPAKLEVKP